MKIQIALMAAVAATALAGTSMAASLSDVVQKGPAAAKVMEKNQINFATAKALGDHCVAEAASKGMGVSVVIIDQFGVISYYARGDGQGKTNTESALWKAKTTLNTRAPSKAQMNAVRTGATSESRVIWQGNFANAGGLPIVVEGQFVELDTGSRAKRFWVGFGAGKSKCEVQMEGFTRRGHAPVFCRDKGR
jgi:uncharacterized protein GlcG (DUF336 family)